MYPPTDSCSRCLPCPPYPDVTLPVRIRSIIPRSSLPCPARPSERERENTTAPLVVFLSPSKYYYSPYKNTSSLLQMDTYYMFSTGQSPILRSSLRGGVASLPRKPPKQEKYRPPEPCNVFKSMNWRIDGKHFGIFNQKN